MVNKLFFCIFCLSLRLGEARESITYAQVGATGKVNFWVLSCLWRNQQSDLCFDLLRWFKLAISAFKNLLSTCETSRESIFSVPGNGRWVHQQESMKRNVRNQ